MGKFDVVYTSNTEQVHEVVEADSEQDAKVLISRECPLEYPPVFQSLRPIEEIKEDTEK